MQHLRLAMEKSRTEQRTRPPLSERPRSVQAGAWEALEQITLDPAHLARNRIVAWERADPANRAFDLLRIQLLQRMRENGWKRVGVTSPHPGGGATVVAANLALGLARRSQRRALLLDLNLGAPGLAAALGQDEIRRDIGGWLSGEAGFKGHFARLGANLALGLASGPVDNGGVCLEAAQRNGRLDAIAAALAAEVTICDLAPALASDEAAAAFPMLDCVLVVAEAGRTSAEDIRACCRLLGDEAAFAGVLLNRSADAPRRG